MPITNNNDPIKYLIKQVVSNDGLGNVTLQPIWPKTAGSQILPETAYRQLGQDSFVLGGTYDTPGGTLSGNTTTVQVGTPSEEITLTLPSVTGTLATLDDVEAVVISVQDGIFDLDNAEGIITVSPYTSASAGKFNNSSTLTAGTTALGYSGYFYANKLYSGGNEVVTAVAENTLSTGQAITDVSIEDNEIVVTRDGFLHLGTSGSSISQTVYGTKTFNSEIQADISGYAKSIFTESIDNNSSFFLTFVNSNNATAAEETLYTDAGVSYNPSTNTLTASVFDGDATLASTVKTISSSTNAAHYLTFVDSNNGSATGEALYTDAGISYNPSSDIFTLSGDLAINGGDITTSATTFNLIDATATTVNAFGAATTLNIGNDGDLSSTTTIAGGITALNNTKTVNIGTGADAAGSTLINIGASGAGIDNSTVTIYGNLVITGTTTTINTNEIQLADNIIVLNSDWPADTAPTESAGIEIYRGTGTNSEAPATLLWDEGEDRWEINGNPIAVSGDIKDSEITIVGGTDLEIDTAGGANGVFTLNQASNETITLNHSSVSRTDTTSTDSPAHGGTFDVVDSVTSSGTGHITAINVKTITLPVGDTYDISASAITGGAQLDLASSSGNDDSLVEFKGSGTTTVTRTDSDTITISSADQYEGTVTSITAGDGMDFTTITSTGTITLGTPSTLSSSTTNALTATSHTHEILSGTLSGTANVVTVTGTGKLLDSGLTIDLADAYGDTLNPYGVKTANTILAGPTSGSAAAPGFRAIVNADLPDSGVDAGTYTATTVNDKGIVTGGFQSIQFGTYTTIQGSTNSTNQPAANLIAGGIFFEALEASDA
jgi:hypothetical protein